MAYDYEPFAPVDYQNAEAHRGIRAGLIVLLLFLLLLSVLSHVWAVPSAVRRTVEVFPEVQSIAVPSVIGDVIAIACLQAAGLIGLRTLWLARANRPDPFVYRWIWATVALLTAFTQLTVVAYVTLSSMGYLPPRSDAPTHRRRPHFLHCCRRWWPEYRDQTLAHGQWDRRRLAPH